MSEQQTAPKAKTKAEPWRVTVRHSPLRLDQKRRTVQATDKESAWAAYLAEVRELVTEESYPKAPKLLKECREWLKAVKKNGPPPATEILPEDYIVRRRGAMLVRGATKAADVGGFAELASV